jgi:ribosomal RNA-processing protein 17
LREQAAENVLRLEKASGAISGSFQYFRPPAGDNIIPLDDEEWHGIGDLSQPDEARRDEYENEEILATVTVVEDFDPDIMAQGPSHPESSTEPYPKSAPQASKTPHPNPKSLKSTKVYYDTKHARQKERAKQHARKFEKAERASGKASRKSGIRKRKR